MAASGDFLGVAGGDTLAKVGWGLTLAMAVPGLYSAPNPSLFTIATFEAMPEHVKRWIHAGSMEAFSQAFLLGLGGSLVAKSWIPFVIVMAMAIWKAVSYERALQGGLEGPRLDMAAKIRESLKAFREPQPAPAAA